MRIGIIGLGNMGTKHANYILEGKVQGAELAAVSDLAEDRLERAKAQWGERVRFFRGKEELLNSGMVDGVMICTPHFDHPSLATEAFGKGLHVLIEKPAGVYTRQVREMNEAAARSGKVFGIMYNQRTHPIYLKLKDLISSGELGEVRRTHWIITDWYRSQSYYNSGGWRATWAGEGGGVLLNQCPHQLDLWQWTTGMMPRRIRAFCAFGKHRDIEVENEVTAFAEYENGATGVFVTSTSEMPGTNRFEITGERGKIVIEENKLTFWRLRVPEPEFNRTNEKLFGKPECWKLDIPVKAGGDGHIGMTQDWVNAVLKGTPLLAPGEEGIRGLMLSNAMLLSTWTDDWVELPMDETLFYDKLQDKIRFSRAKKTEGPDQIAVIGTKNGGDLE